MQATKIFEAQVWEVSGTLTTNFTQSHVLPIGTPVGYLGWGKGVLESAWANDPFSVSSGVKLTAYFENNTGVGNCYGQIEIPALSLNQTYAVAGLPATIAVRLEIDNLRVYCLPNGVLKVTGTDLRFYIDGTLKYTRGSSFSITNSLYFAPAGIPLFGIPPEILSDCDTGWSGGVGDVRTSWSFIVDIRPVMAGGWRFKQNGNWYTLPIKVGVGSPPGCSCTGPSISGFITGTDTYGASVASARRTEGGYVATGFDDCGCYAGPGPCLNPDLYAHKGFLVSSGEDMRNTRLTLLPNLGRSVKRMIPEGYAAIVYRGGLPWADRVNDTICGGLTPPPPGTDPGSGGAICPSSDRLFDSEASLLATVTQSAHAIEKPLTLPIYAPFSIGRQVWQFETWNCVAANGGGTCPPPVGWCPAPPPDNVAINGTSTSAFPNVQLYIDNVVGGVRQMFAYLDHPDDRVRYVNYWANPHWSYSLWFEDWSVYGTPADRRTYWQRLREQWLYNAALPSREQRRTRNHIVAEPLYDSGLRTIWNTVLGNGLSPWGITGWITNAAPPYAAYTYSASTSANWAFTNCTAAFGAKITLTPTGGHTDLVAELDLGLFNAEPYLYPHICSQINAIPIVNSGITAIKAYLVSEYGQKVLLADTATGYKIKTVAAEAKYAGSWAQDYGIGAVADTGTDTSAIDGKSSASLGSPELVTALCLLAGRTDAKLRYELTLAAAAPVDIDYPWLEVPIDAPRIFGETGQSQDILYPDGPGLRFGQQSWYDSGSAKVVPNVMGPGWKASALDWLCWRRVMLRGVDRLDNLTTEISGLWDSVEGNTITDIGFEDSVTDYGDRVLSFVLPHVDHALSTTVFWPIQAAMVGPFTLPPLAVFPHQARDSDWLETGAHAQEAWSWCQERRYSINSLRSVSLKPPGTGTAEWLTPIASPPSSWFVGYHIHAVDNTEGPSFIMAVDGEDVAHVSPWHGYFSNVWHRSGGPVHLTRAPSGPLFAAIVGGSSAQLQCYRFQFGAIGDLIDVPGVTGITHAQIAFHPSGRVLIVYEKTGKVWLVESSSWGSRWESPVKIVDAGTWPAICIDNTGIAYIVYHDGATWQVLRRVEDAGSWINVANFGAGAAGRLCLELSPLWSCPMVAVYVQGGNVYWVESSRRGELWTSPTLIAAGTMAAFAICPEIGESYVAIRGASHWTLWRHDPDQSIFVAESAIVTLPDIEAGLESHPGAAHELIFLIDDGTQLRPILSKSHGERWA